MIDGVEPFRSDTKQDDSFIARASDYNGETEVILAPWPSTIHERSQKERQQILDDWLDLLSRPTPIRKLTLWCHVNDRLLGGIRAQTQIDHLRIHWGSYTDLSPIAGMASMKQLILGGASAVTDLAPLRALRAITHLEIENGRALRDYAPLGDLSSLRSLRVTRSLTGSRTNADSLEFIRSLTDLEALYWDPRVATSDYSPLLSLTKAKIIGVTNLKGMTPSFVDLEWALSGVQAHERFLAERVIPISVDGEGVRGIVRDVTGRKVYASPDSVPSPDQPEDLEA
ncbi:hypothetical protein [Microbacterium sp.]|uniref:hypothetical protein n=1 Tax=Microbacterium sp. TaxID=51671 RepID=UPI002FDFF4AF